jgi:hypothetical protein
VQVLLVAPKENQEGVLDHLAKLHYVGAPLEVHICASVWCPPLWKGQLEVFAASGERTSVRVNVLVPAPSHGQARGERLKSRSLLLCCGRWKLPEPSTHGCTYRLCCETSYENLCVGSSDDSFFLF